MENSNSGFMPGARSDNANVSSGGNSSGITGKIKNLATPESHAAGMMGMGGMGGPGGTAAASALGSNVPSMPSHTGGMSNVDSPNAHAFNRDSSHSGFGGHNPASDSYGRDTTNSETYGPGNTNLGNNQDYSMSSDRDQLHRNINQGVLGSGNMTSSGMGASSLGTGTGTMDGNYIRHQTVNADSHLRTDSTRTGVNSGSGIHAEQYSGRSGGASTVSGMGSGIGQSDHHQHHMGSGTGQNDLHHQHHLHGQGDMKQASCGMCHPGENSMRDSNSTTTSSRQERTGMGGGSMGKYETSTSSSGMAGRGANEREISSGTSAGNLHNISSQGIEGMRDQPSASGPVGSNISGQQMETGKASMADKIIGGAEKMAGKMTANPDMVKEGEMKAAGNAAKVSRN